MRSTPPISTSRAEQCEQQIDEKVKKVTSSIEKPAVTTLHGSSRPMNGRESQYIRRMDEKAFEFNFDDWATLYQTDPYAFESKRQAVLMIEAARSGPAARETVSMLLAQKPSRDRQIRLEGALNQMTRSMAVLAIHLHDLAHHLNRFHAEVDPGELA
jgi:hypothetical protein